MGLQDALKKFSDEVKDLATLTVTTYTGSLSQAVNAETGEIDWDKFRPDSGELQMVAATQIKADYDTVNFRAASAGGDNVAEMILVHQAAVETAQNGRASLLKLLSGTLSGLG